MSSAPATSSRSSTGAWAATGAFLMWGVFPLYWKQLADIPATELIAHRVVWSLALLLALVRLRGRGAQFFTALRNRRNCALYLLSGSLLGLNWLLFVWAVNAGHVLDSSLGYFLNPLCNVALGFFLLGERLRPVQWTAVGCAVAGVIVQLVELGRVPWIALGLAATFAFYGLLRKRGPLGPVAGLALETLLLTPLAAGFLLWLAAAGRGAFGHVGATQHAWLLAAGLVTSVPLLLFATAARALPLSVLGVFQYLAPTGQFLLGVWYYREPFGRAQALSFGLIWLGLVLFSVDALRQRRRDAVVPAA